MPSFIRQGASVTASILETTAGALRKLADTETASSTETPAPQAAAPATEKPRPRPASGTRSRISNPKAARKVRAREG